MQALGFSSAFKLKETSSDALAEESAVACHLLDKGVKPAMTEKQ